MNVIVCDILIIYQQINSIVQKYSQESHVGMGAALIVRNHARYKKCKSYNKRASAQEIDRGSILKERIERERDFLRVIEWVYA